MPSTTNSSQRDTTGAMETKGRELHRPPAPGAYPWLVYFNGKGNKNQIFCSISDPNKTHVRRIPEFRDKDFWFSYHGWCAFSTWSGRFILWNPITLEKIWLPMMDPELYVYHCTLSSPPGESDCMVLFFDKYLPLIIFCRPGDEQWTKLDYRKELKRSLMESGEPEDICDETLPLLESPICLNGFLYATAEYYYTVKLVQIQIHEIKPNSLKIKSLVCLPVKPLYSIHYKFHLLGSRGKLYTMKILYGDESETDIVAIEVYRLVFSQMEWRRVKSAKDLVFFLSNDDCLVSSSSIHPEIKANRVYFCLDGGKNLYSYNIEDRSVSVSPPWPNLPPLRSSPIWVMPNLRLTNPVKEGKHIVDEGKEIVGGKVREKSSDVKEDVMEKRNIKETHLFDIPSEIVGLIGKRLVLVDYLHFRATSKMCRSIAPPIRWKIATRSLNKPSLSPWLMFFEKGRNTVCAFIDPMNVDDKYLMKLPQSLSAGCIFCCLKDGWVLIFVGIVTKFLFNPFMGKILRLSNAPLKISNVACIGFSSSPTSSDYLVVYIDMSFLHPIIVLYFTRPGWEGWEYREFDSSDDFLLSNNCAVFYKGAFYCLGRKGNLGILKPEEDEEFSWNVLHMPNQPCSGHHQNCLVECDGDLLSVFVGPFGRWVQVFRLNVSTMKWIKVESLGNHTLYVSRSSSFSAEARTPGMGNKIYFPRFYGQSIVFYSLETKKYHSLESKDSIVDFYSTRETLQCAWIEPTWY